ncbi:MAG TPA: hypothetical protein VD770_02365 [Coxiellaceae bacterium]|nr:hypothetical protein [Coxiellaceae bacterium]
MSFRTYIAILLTLVSTGGYASSTKNDNSPPTNNAPTKSAWKFEIAPYFWAMNMNGNTQMGELKSSVSESFSDIMQKFQSGGSIFLNAKKDKWSIFANALYVKLQKTDSARITTSSNFGLFSGGINYEMFEHAFSESSQFNLSPYVGFRYTVEDGELSSRLITVSNDQQWADPIVGLELDYDLNARWSAILAGDVGGTSSQDNSYNAQALIGYNPTFAKDLNLYLGYRFLYQHYVTGSGADLFAWNMRLFGPVVGLSFIF